jgi:hypothetical protein
MANRFRSQAREVINRNTVVSLALEEGFNAFLPVYDGGIDFVLYRERDGLVRKVQLKSRWTVERKYVGRDIWIAFPIGADWYLTPHDQMHTRKPMESHRLDRGSKAEVIRDLGRQPPSLPDAPLSAATPRSGSRSC